MIAMMCLGLNKRTFYYSLYLGETDIVDSEGNLTGGKAKQYSEPVAAEMNVSAAHGDTSVEQFGLNENYSRTIVTDDMNCPIDTDSKLWIEIPPTEPYNYRVVRVAKSLNSITYAIREVTVSA